MKARQIIPGWPRGRSTVSYKLHLWQDQHWPQQYQTPEMLNMSFWEMFYHGDQQDMVNTYFESWRLRYPLAVPLDIRRYYPWP